MLDPNNYLKVSNMSQNVKFVINTVDREKEIVRMTLKNIKFLKDNKINFSLPVKTVEEEYDIKKYETFREKVEQAWDKKKDFTQRLLTFFHEPLETKFVVEISNYGPLGFYSFNKHAVTINLNTRLNPIDTIMHEMTHIMVEPFVLRYHISYHQKENIVNAILRILETTPSI